MQEPVGFDAEHAIENPSAADGLLRGEVGQEEWAPFVDDLAGAMVPVSDKHTRLEMCGEGSCRAPGIGSSLLKLLLGGCATNQNDGLILRAASAK
jgi:hypothetical protein